MMSTDAPFSSKSINDAVARLEAEEGNSLNVGIESEAGQRPSLTVEAQGEHENLTWAAWAKSKLTKASTAVGAKIGFKW